jgi:hypothetical protein
MLGHLSVSDLSRQAYGQLVLQLSDDNSHGMPDDR